MATACLSISFYISTWCENSEVNSIRLREEDYLLESKLLSDSYMNACEF